jgi:hypothetical protein
VAVLPDATRVANALRAAPVDVVVVCTDDPTYCQQLVHECRAQIIESEQSVPLIAWQTAPRVACADRAIMLHIGADSVLEAPSTTTDLLACTFALRRLMRNVQFAG